MDPGLRLKTCPSPHPHLPKHAPVIWHPSVVVYVEMQALLSYVYGFLHILHISIYMRLYICLCVCLCVYICIYVYIHSLCLYTYIFTDAFNFEMYMFCSLPSTTGKEVYNNVYVYKNVYVLLFTLKPLARRFIIITNKTTQSGWMEPRKEL